MCRFVCPSAGALYPVRRQRDIPGKSCRNLRDLYCRSVLFPQRPAVEHISELLRRVQRNCGFRGDVISGIPCHGTAVQIVGDVVTHIEVSIKVYFRDPVGLICGRVAVVLQGRQQVTVFNRYTCRNAVKAVRASDLPEAGPFLRRMRRMEIVREREDPVVEIRIVPCPAETCVIVLGRISRIIMHRVVRSRAAREDCSVCMIVQLDDVERVELPVRQQRVIFRSCDFDRVSGCRFVIKSNPFLL